VDAVTVKLHMGCGNVILPGWINLDANPGPFIDAVDDARTLRSIPLASVDAIYASHLLDHLGRNEIDPVLREWRGRLVQGGVLRISVGDFAAIVEEYRAGRPLRDLLGLLIGGHRDEYDRHGMIFDHTTIEDALSRAGFGNVRTWDWRRTEHAEHDDYSRAYLPHMDLDHGRLMSLNVEATSMESAMPEPEWHVLGDSHAWVFTQATGHPRLFDAQRPVRSLDGRFSVNRLGPWTIRSLGRPERRDAITKAVDGVPSGSKVVLCFGEIDCRCDIVPQAKERGANLDAICLDVARCYFDVVNDLVRRGYRMHVWGGPPPTGGPVYNQEFPANGTYAERRAAQERLNGHLSSLAEANGARYASIYDHLVCGNRTQTEFFLDYIHVNPSRAWPFVEEALRG